MRCRRYGWITHTCATTAHRLNSAEISLCTVYRTDETELQKQRVGVKKIPRTSVVVAEFVLSSSSSSVAAAAAATALAVVKETKRRRWIAVIWLTVISSIVHHTHIAYVVLCLSVDLTIRPLPT